MIDYTFVELALRNNNRQRLPKRELICLINIMETIISEKNNEIQELKKQIEDLELKRKSK